MQEQQLTTYCKTIYLIHNTNQQSLHFTSISAHYWTITNTTTIVEHHFSLSSKNGWPNRKSKPSLRGSSKNLFYGLVSQVGGNYLPLVEISYSSTHPS